jgi:hypothetical protein
MNANYKISNLDERVRYTLAKYRENVEEAHRISRGRGSRFLHFLQPSLYSLSSPGEYEKKLLSLGLIPSQAESAFLSTYPHLRKVTRDRAHRDNTDFDLTPIFDNLGQSVYLDFCHVNHVGNQVIADNIYLAMIKSKALATTE